MLAVIHKIGPQSAREDMRVRAWLVISEDHGVRLLPGANYGNALYLVIVGYHVHPRRHFKRRCVGSFIAAVHIKVAYIGKNAVVEYDERQHHGKYVPHPRAQPAGKKRRRKDRKEAVADEHHRTVYHIRRDYEPYAGKERDRHRSGDRKDELHAPPEKSAFYRGDDRADRRSRKEHEIQHAVKIQPVGGSGAFDRHEPGVSAAPGEPPDNIRRREFKPRRRIYTEIRDRLCVLSRKADAPHDVVKYHSDGVYRRLPADVTPRLAVRAATLKHFADEVYGGQDQCERNIRLIYPAREAQKHR